MTNITNINSQRFTLNGISYYKNFLSQVIGDSIRIVNAYDSKFELLRPTKYNNLTLNGQPYPSVQALQMALLPVIYTRGTLGNGAGADNGIVQMGTLELIESTSTVGTLDLRIPIVPVVPIWRIGGIEYTKLTVTRINIPPAANGFYRIDVIIANTANGFERIVGEERDDVGIPPQLPYNVVPVTQINIFGDIVNDGDPTPPPPPPPLNQFITKSSKQYRSYKLTNSVSNTLYLSHEHTTFRMANASGTGIVKGFVTLSESSDGPVYDGMDIYVKNTGIADITIKHMDLTAQIPFWFSEGRDLIVKHQEIYHLKYNGKDNRVELVITALAWNASQWN